MLDTTGEVAMKFICSLLIFAIVSSATFAKDFKKVYIDKINDVCEICSPNPDGTLDVAYLCKDGGPLKKPHGVYRPSDVTEITTWITDRSPGYNSTTVLGTYDQALVGINFATVDGRSGITIFRPSEETKRKNKAYDGLMVNTRDIGTSVSEKNGYKVGDKICVAEDDDNGWRGQGGDLVWKKGTHVKITHLFDKDNFAVIELRDANWIDSIFARPRFVPLSNLVACTERARPALDPNQLIKNSSGKDDISIVDKSLKNSPKEITDSVINSCDAGIIPRPGCPDGNSKSK